MGKTEAQKRAQKKWRSKVYNTICLIIKKETRLKELLVLAAAKSNKTNNQYVIDALYAQLARDGITLDMLNDYNPPAPEPKQPKRNLCYLILSQYYDPDDGPEYNPWYEYVTVTGTLEAARKYIHTTLHKKAYPDRWKYTIQGRYIEAFTKLDAVNKYKEMTKEAAKGEVEDFDFDFIPLDDEDEIIIDGPILDEIDMVGMTEEDDFTKKLGEPEYVEVITV